jgi:hypothetical protein
MGVSLFCYIHAAIVPNNSENLRTGYLRLGAGVHACNPSYFGGSQLKASLGKNTVSDTPSQ